MKAITVGTTALLAVAIAQSASADCWSMTFAGYGLHQTVGVRFNNSEAWDSATANSGFAGVSAGQLNFTVFGQTYSNYCVQLFEGVGQVGETNTWCTAAIEDVPEAPPAPGPMGALKATLVQDLYARFHATVKDSADANDHAAFQVVLWELTHEKFDAATAVLALDQIDLLEGALQLNGAHATILALANDMIDALGDGGFQSIGDNLIGLTSQLKQDHLVVVPIPAPVLIAGLGLLGVGILRRRMK
ncbi:MAG: hypothetical protein SGJ11_00995 [Phycisphaerae bacterium]|nr:hypothetical protein [Phycisphaerae bacterium]